MALRISAVTGSLGKSGAGVAAAVNSLYRALHRHGEIDVTIHCVEAPEAQCGARIKRYSTIGPSRFGFSRQLARDLSGANPDLIHVHGLWSYASIAAAAWRRAGGGPIVVSPHGMLDAWALRANALRKTLALALFERRNLAAANCLHALNREEAASMRALGLRNPVAIIPNGVELSPETTQRREQGARRLLFLGRIHPKKGLAQFLHAWALLARSRPEIAARWVVDIVGWDEGGHLKQLQALASELALRDRVNFCGPLFGNDKARAFAEASAFILPSLSEGLPITVLEAWAYGLPVLMTRACNLPVGFEMRAAIEIDGDPATMAVQLGNAFADVDALAAMGRAGRKLVEEKFSWNDAAAKMLALYQWLAARGTRPAFVE